MKSEFPIEWSHWARNQGLTSGFFLLSGGIVALFYPRYYFGIVNILTGLLVCLIEGPYLPKIVYKVLDIYYLRCLLYAGFMVPSMWLAPTQTAGFVFAFCILTYLIAAINGEPFPSKKPSPRQ